MANAHIQAAANDLLRAAADKRTEEQEIQRQTADLKRQTDLQMNAKNEEIKSHQRLIAYDRDAPETTYLNKRIHDAHEEAKKLINMSKRKMSDLTLYASQLETQAKQLEVKARSLSMKS